MKAFPVRIQSYLFGFLGIAGFSLTLPATRLAVTDLDPTFIGLGRAPVAAVLAGLTLLLTRSPIPSGTQWFRLAGTALGIVVGFPLFASWAMATLPASHGAVVGAILPLVTALFGAGLAGERPAPLFWISSVAGSGTIALFALSSGGGSFQSGDLMLVAAIVAAGFGYAEGARLSKELGPWQTISWTLVVSAPLLAIPAYKTMPHDLSAIGWKSAAGFAYVSTVSMFLAYIAWYRGLSTGGIARIGQIQLLQPFLTIFAAVLLLQEHATWKEGIAASIVLFAVLMGKKASTDNRVRVTNE